MSSRNLLFSTIAMCHIAPCLLAQGDVFLREERKLDPSNKALMDAMPRLPADAPLTPQLKTDVEVVVRHAIYPLTDKVIRTTPNRMSQTVDACETRIRNAFQSAEVKNIPLQDEILRKMIEELGVILLNNQQEPITRVNAGRLLARLAALTGREEVADLLIKVVADDKQPEGSRYYGLMGMRELMAKLVSKGGGFKVAKRKTDMVSALVAYIERQPPFMPTTEAEVDGLRFMRREAIRALAEARVSRIAGDPNGHAALALARVAGKDKAINPEPRLDEQLEAAIGLCLLPADATGDLQVGYVSYLIGQFAHDFAQAYKDPRRSSRDPWKVFGGRFLDAMKEFVNTHGREPSAKTLGALALKVVEDVEKKSQTLNTGPLGQWTEKNTTGQQTIYKSDPKSAVVPAEVKGM